jgi:hypothetical protein
MFKVIKNTLSKQPNNHKFLDDYIILPSRQRVQFRLDDNSIKFQRKV